ncbi:MAG: regulatory protein RecX [Phocaeicola sp.]
MKKEYTIREALVKAEAYCVAAERCIYDVESKLEQWGISKSDLPPLIEKLCNERYLDESRYCRAFVRDKYRFNQWGRVKISQALRMKRIPSAQITESLYEIDEEEYLNILKALLRQKNKSVKAKNSYEHSGKLMRFALGKGYEMNHIQQCLKELNADYDIFD